jgi:hypothetical protein
MAFGQSQAHLAAGARDYALESRARNAHALSGLFLRQAFQIGQAQCFQFLVEQRDQAQVIQWHPGWFVNGWLRHTCQGASLAGAWHRRLALAAVLMAAVATSAQVFAFWAIDLFTTRQVDDLGTHLLSELFQLGAADESMVDVQIGALGSNDSETRPAGAFTDVLPFAHKDLAHRSLLLYQSVGN